MAQKVEDPEGYKEVREEMQKVMQHNVAAEIDLNLTKLQFKCVRV